jgi:hypothetical protein
VKHYRAFGLEIRSEIDLPELVHVASNAVVDTEVLLGSVEGPLPVNEPRVVRFERPGAYLAWSNIGRFRVEGTRIIVDPLTDDPRAIRFALLGPVLAAMLQLRGIPLLHGSAVAIEDQAIAFIGRKRAGKSTTAAAFVAAGGRMLSDDILPLSRDGADLSLTPGFPALKLEPTVHRALLRDLPIVGGEGMGLNDKVLVSDGTASSANLPIRAMFVLDPDAPAEPVRLLPAAALRELLQHGYALKFADGALSDGQAPALFETCARLAGESLVFRAGPFNDLAALPDHARRLLDLCAANSPLDSDRSQSSGRSV